MVFSGRIVRHEMLEDRTGKWRQNLWLESLVAPAVAGETSKTPPVIVLTTPLPINTCSEDSLTLLPGVGPVLAGRIAVARREGQWFANVADLQSVKGIGPALSARLDTLVDYSRIAPADSSSKTR